MSKHRSSKTLFEARSWLQNPEVRNAKILEVAERNSVIEGLPPFSKAFRERMSKRYSDKPTNSLQH